MQTSTKVLARQNGMDRPCQRYNVVPLTTIFTPHASCAQRFTPFSSAGTATFTHSSDSACIPLADCPWSFGIHFSPGLCPSGYTTFSSSVATDDSTVATCCSRSFALQEGPSIATPQCMSTITDRQTKIITWDFTSTWTTSSTDLAASRLVAVAMYSVYPTSATTVVTWAIMLMPPIYVTARKGDFPVTTLPLTTASSSSTSFSTSSASPTNPPSETPSARSGLSTGAKAGIGIGAAAALVLLGIGALLLWRRKRGKRSNIKAETPHEWAKTELSAEEVKKAGFKTDQDKVVHELHGETQPRELP